MTDHSAGNSVEQTGSIRARLYGQFAVMNFQDRIITPKGRKTAALLGYLIVAAGEKVSRDRLASLLWSDRGEDQARASLRQALYDLRLFTTGPSRLIVVDRAYVQIDPKQISTDWEDIQQAGTDARKIAALVGKAPLDFLAGFDGLSEGFDEWLLPERTRHHEERRQIMLAAGRNAVAESADIAGQLAASLLNADALDEGAAQLAIASARARGDYDSARRAFARIQASLKSELGVEPSQETRAMLEDTLPTVSRHKISADTQDTLLKGSRPPPLSRRAVVAGGFAVSAAAASGIGIWAYLRQAETPADLSIAVLPFANLSGDPKQTYFADGLTEELRTSLAQIPDMTVIGRISSEAVRNLSANEAATKLGVAYVLTGSVRQSPTVVRVSVQLLEGATGAEKWSSTYDRAPDEALTIQGGIAEAIAWTVSARVGAIYALNGEQGGTRSPEAYDLFLKAAASDDGNGNLDKRWRQSLELLTRACEIDPNYGRAMAARAFYTMSLAYFSDTSVKDRSEHFAEAAKIAQKAIAIAPRMAIGYSTLGLIQSYQLHLKDALTQFRRANVIGMSIGSLLDYGYFLGWTGRADEAMAVSKRLRIVDPFGTSAADIEFLAYFSARKYAQAKKAAEREVTNDPSFKLYIAQCLVLLGQPEGALAMLSSIPEAIASDNIEYFKSSQALAYARMGDTLSCNRATQELRDGTGDTARYSLAQIEAQKGEHDSAIHLLNLAWQDRNPDLIIAPQDEFLDPLRSDPKFKLIIARLNSA